MASQLPTTMRASQWTSNAQGIETSLRINTSAPLPASARNLAANHTLVKVAYTSLNPFDYKVAETPIVGQYALSKPSIPCLDFAGTVVSTNNPSLKPDDHVFGRTNPPAFGCLAEYVVVDAPGIAKVPSNVSLRDAATAGIAALAAYQSIAPYVQPGSKVFINGGSGGTGTYGIQIAKALGCQVTTTCSTRNIELCKSLGADKVIDYTQHSDLLPIFAEHAPFDLLVDNVFSNPDLYWKSHLYLSPDGVFVTPGDTKASSLKNLLLANVLPAWLGGGQRKFVFVRNQPKNEDLERIAQWMGEGKVKAVIEKEFAMEDAGEAFAELKKGRTRGKIVVKVAEE